MAFERMYKVDVSGAGTVKLLESNPRRVALSISTPGAANLWSPNLPVFAANKNDADTGAGMELVSFPSAGYQGACPIGEIWFKPPFALSGAHLNIFERIE